jgi:hypothetical protein
MGVFIMAAGWLRGRDAEDATVAVETARRGGAAPAAAPVREVRYDPPVRVRGTEARVVLLRDLGAYSRREDSYSSSSRGAPGAIVNVAFLPADSGAGRLLVDGPAYFSEVQFPGADPSAGAGTDSLLRWIVYRGTITDTNRDERVDHRDDESLYVSALDGTAFRRVLPDGFRVRHAEPLGDGRTMLVTALELPRGGGKVEEERLPQRAFFYDVPAARLRPYTALDSLARRAGELIVRR